LLLLWTIDLPNLPYDKDENGFLRGSSCRRFAIGKVSGEDIYDVVSAEPDSGFPNVCSFQVSDSEVNVSDQNVRGRVDGQGNGSWRIGCKSNRLLPQDGVDSFL
jgi:hypothetical protein